MSEQNGRTPTERSTGRKPTREGSRGKQSSREAELVRRFRNEGDLDAREALILRYLPVVNHLVKQFLEKGVPYDDLYQEGCYGLILAIDRFDPSKKTDVATFARYYILKHLYIALDDAQSACGALSDDTIQRAKKVKQSVEMLTAKLGHPPSAKEISADTGLSYKIVVQLLPTINAPVSFDDPSGEPICHAAASAPSAEEEVLSVLNEMDLSTFNVDLTKREQTVLFLRFGFGPSNEMLTFSEIGRRLGFCDEYVSRIYKEAIRKLRESETSNI